nr:MAG TPA: hypothetical protein [Caudoviricetes sp.]
MTDREQAADTARQCLGVAILSVSRCLLQP